MKAILLSILLLLTPSLAFLEGSLSYYDVLEVALVMNKIHSDESERYVKIFIEPKIEIEKSKVKMHD